MLTSSVGRDLLCGIQDVAAASTPDLHTRNCVCGN
jgi:hypothetical protein